MVSSVELGENLEITLGNLVAIVGGDVQRGATPLVRQMVSYRMAGLFSQASVNTMFRQYCCCMEGVQNFV